jgi:hypothetical protein
MLTSVGLMSETGTDQCWAGTQFDRLESSVSILVSKNQTGIESDFQNPNRKQNWTSNENWTQNRVKLELKLKIY